MFAALGIGVAGYVAYALAVGEVWGRGRWRLAGVVYLRTDDPFGYWSTIAAYAALAVALLTVF